jgi:hypothetical protein
MHVDASFFSVLLFYIFETIILFLILGADDDVEDIKYLKAKFKCVHISNL